MRLSDTEKFLLRMALRNLLQKKPQISVMVNALLCKVAACASDKRRTLACKTFDDENEAGEWQDREKLVAEFSATLDPSDLVSVTTRDEMAAACVMTEIWYWKDAE